MNSDQKVTLYANVLNEAHSIDRLLVSVDAQTRKYDEFIIIDGGSNDGTLEVLERYVGSHPNVKLILYPGSRIGEARNRAIASSSFDLVASIDAGCHAEKEWLERLMAKMTPEVDIVSGAYLPDPATDFERCVGDLMYPRIDSLPDDWTMPSHRSVLLRKRVWQALGGFPPHLGPSEDTWFDIEAARLGFKFKLARDAVVYWRPRRNLVEVFKSSFRFMLSDVRHRIGLESLSRRTIIIKTADMISLLGWCTALVTTFAISPLIGGVGLVIFTALMVRPFRTIHLYFSEKSWRGKITKNLINLTNSVAWSLGYVLGIAARVRKSPSLVVSS